MNENIENSANSSGINETFQENSQAEQIITAPRKGNKAAITIIVLALCVLILGSGALAYTQLFQRDINIMIFGEQKYALGLEQKSMIKMSGNFQNAISLLLKNSNVAKSTKTDMNMELKLEPSMYDMLGAGMGPEGSKTMESVINYLNTMSMTATQTTTDKGSKSTLKIAEKTGDFLTLNSWTDNKNTIFQIPDVSPKYIQIPMNANLQVSQAIKIDSVKLKTSLESVLKVYIESLKDAKITITDNQTVKIDDVSVTAKKISVTLTEAQLNKLCKDVITAVRDDKYLQEMIIANVNSTFELYSNAQFQVAGDLGKEKLTIEKYKEWCNKIISEIEKEQPADGKYILNTYATPSNIIVARTYEIIPADKSSEKIVVQILMPSEGGVDGQKAFNWLVNDKELFRAVLRPTSLTDGTIKAIATLDENQAQVGFNINYKNLIKAPWNGSDIFSGTYTITLIDPDNEIASNFGAKDNFPELMKSSMIIGYSVNKGALESTIKIALKGIGEFNFKTKTTNISLEKIEKPVINKDNSITYDMKTPNTDAMVLLGTEIQTGAIKHIVKLAKRNSELAKILESFGMSAETLEAMANGTGIIPDTTGGDAAKIRAPIEDEYANAINIYNALNADKPITGNDLADAASIDAMLGELKPISEGNEDISAILAKIEILDGVATVKQS